MGAPAEMLVVSVQQGINDSSGVRGSMNNTTWIDTMMQIKPAVGDSSLNNYLRGKYYGKVPTFS